MRQSSRNWMGSVLCAVAMMVGGCEDGDDVHATDAHAHVADAATVDAGTTVDASTTDPDAGKASAAPVISKVSWKHASGCKQFTPGDVTVTVEVTDADTAADKLTFSISIPGCGTAKTTNPATLKCPEAATYSGASASVTDPEKNTDKLTFAVAICTDGSAQ